MGHDDRERGTTMGKTTKTLAQRLADAKAKAAKKAHQDRIADRKAVSELNKARRANG